MKAFIKDCQYCSGTGMQGETITAPFDPQDVVEWECPTCEGEGKVLDQDSIEDRIYEVKDMIEGMLIRINTTSNTLKDLSRGMFYELLPKYKHRLYIQTRALARLELYLVTLEKY